MWWWVSAALAGDLVAWPPGALGISAPPTPQGADPQRIVECVVTVEVRQAYQPVSVTGCDEPWAAAAAEHVSKTVPTVAALTRFREQSVPVRVSYAPSGHVWRTDEPAPRLDAATAVAEPPEKLVNKDAYRVRGGDKGRCDIEVWADEDGVPYALGMSACPPGIQVPIELAAFGWRFAPTLVDGKPVPARFVTEIRVE